MRLSDLIEALDLMVLTDGPNLAVDVTGGYASDLMSDAIAHAQPGDVWVTLQIHLNVIAVASMKEAAAVLFIGGRKPNDEGIEKANEERIVLLSTELPAFEIIGKLYGLGVRSVARE